VHSAAANNDNFMLINMSGEEAEASSRHFQLLAWRFFLVDRLSIAAKMEN
jgi:hypothetical protein